MLLGKKSLRFFQRRNNYERCYSALYKDPSKDLHAVRNREIIRRTVKDKVKVSKAGREPALIEICERLKYNSLVVHSLR